jgi:cytochrome c peroxidase
MHKIIHVIPPFLIISLLGINLSACGSGSSNDTTSSNNASNNSITDTSLRHIISTRNLTGDALKNRTIPKIESAKAQLGMRLFFSKSLSGDRDTACVTGHHPTLGGGDNLSLPIGVGAEIPNLLGEGRLHSSAAIHYDAGPTVPRNAPTTFNVAAWDKVLFHDGRAESLGKTPLLNGNDGLGIRTPDVFFDMADPLSGNNLAVAQARFPVTSPAEMKGFNHNDKNNQGIRDFLASRLGNYGTGAGELSDSSYWLVQFRNVFGETSASATELITEQNIAMLIGEYERSQAFSNTAWRHYIEGNNQAISEEAKQGALIFFQTKTEGGANCASCHSSDLFSDEGFHNIAMPQMGHGKGDTQSSTSDFGRFRETGDEDDKYAFRTPSLLNVEMTGPWSHAGAYTSLRAVVKHHLNPEMAIANYDFSQLSQTGIQNLDKLSTNTQVAWAKLSLDRLLGRNVIEKIDLSDQQIDQVIAFLHSLTDPCVKDRACLSQWIPPTNEDPNGDQLDAIDASATAL